MVTGRPGIAVILCSPPYGLEKDFEKGLTPEMVFEDTKPVWDESCRKLCPGGYLVINIRDINNFARGKGKNKRTEWHFVAVIVRSI